jgi:hypothetical protein
MVQPQGVKHRLRVETKTQVSYALVYKRIRIYTSAITTLRASGRSTIRKQEKKTYGCRGLHGLG